MYRDLLIELIVVLVLFVAVAIMAFAAWQTLAEAQGAPAPAARSGREVKEVKLAGKWKVTWGGVAYDYDFRGDGTLGATHSATHSATLGASANWEGTWVYDARSRELRACEWRTDVEGARPNTWAVKLGPDLTGKGRYLERHGEMVAEGQEFALAFRRASPECACACREQADCPCRRGGQVCAVGCTCLAARR